MEITTIGLDIAKTPFHGVTPVRRRHPHGHAGRRDGEQGTPRPALGNIPEAAELARPPDRLADQFKRPVEGHGRPCSDPGVALGGEGDGLTGGAQRGPAPAVLEPGRHVGNAGQLIAECLGADAAELDRGPGGIGKAVDAGGEFGIVPGKLVAGRLGQ